MNKTSLNSNYGNSISSNTITLNSNTSSGTLSSCTISGSWSSSTINIGSIPSSFTFTYPKVEISVLGRTFLIFPDTFQQLQLSLIDFNGILFYKSLLKNKVLISDNEVKNYLDSLLKIEERNNIIDNLITL